MATTFIELSHLIEPGMKTYPGLPVPESSVFLSRETSREKFAGQAEFLIASLHLCGNTGTYVDSPFHRYAEGADLADLPLNRLAHLPIAVLQARDAELGVTPDLFEGVDVGGAAVLIHTNFSQHWGTPRYFGPHPFLTAAGAAYLRDAQAAFVGIDSINLDDMRDLARPAHTILLGAGIPVCEHMTNLAALGGGGGRLHAVPIAWRGGATFPVRAYVVRERTTAAR